MRKTSSIRLGLLLAVSAVLTSCSSEKPEERRCVDSDGRFVDEAACGATGGWDQADGGAPPARGGYHFIWIPYGAFGGVGSFAPAHLRSGTGGAPPGAATSGSVTRGGFGATGAAHGGAAASAGT